MLLQEEREKIVVYGQEMLKRGLTAGTFGNLSIYNEKENLFAISPSGMDYFKTDASDVVVMTLDGEKADGDRKPSSEVDMHRIFYQKRRASSRSCTRIRATLLHWRVSAGAFRRCTIWWRIRAERCRAFRMCRSALMNWHRRRWTAWAIITPAFSEITVCCASAAISATRWMCPSRSNSAHSSIIIVRQPVRSRSC